MPAIIRPRNSDGSFGEPKKFGNGDTDAEKVAKLQALNKSLMLTVTDMFEENLELRELNRNVMLVVTDLYETVYSAEEGVTK